MNSYDSNINDLMYLLVSTTFRNNPITTKLNGNFGNSVLAYNGIWDRLSYTEEVKNITIPSLFLWGKYDMVVPPQLGRNAFEKCGSNEKKLVIFEKSGHSPMDHESTKFANEIIEFIEAYK